MDSQEMESCRRFESCIREIEELLDEMRSCIKDCAREGMIEERAESYWIAHIRGALRQETGLLGGSMVTAEDTLEELRAPLKHRLYAREVAQRYAAQKHSGELVGLCHDPEEPLESYALVRKVDIVEPSASYLTLVLRDREVVAEEEPELFGKMQERAGPENEAMFYEPRWAVSVEGSEEELVVAPNTWLGSNEDGLSEQERFRLKHLRSGQSFQLGGGAQPMVEIRRIF